MKALLTTGNKSVSIGETETPRPGEGEILVKVTYVAQNPTDWKMLDVPAGRVVGCDFAGTVADSNGSQWREGQRIAGWVHGRATDPPRGAFAEYLVTESEMVFPVPDDITDQQAATISAPFATAVQALVQRLKLPEPSDPAKTALPLLVNGGSTSVGMYAIQLGKLAGLYVVATGSRKNHTLLKSLGADIVVDYSTKNWPKRVRRITNDSLEHVLDCVGEFSTILSTASALSSTKGGHILTLLPVGPVRESGEVDIEKVKLESTLAYTVFGRPISSLYDDFDNFTPTSEDKAIWEKYLVMLPELLRSGKIKPNNVREMGTIDDIPAGFEAQKKGDVRAEKLVYKVM
ncbi:hypothetical protein DL766_000913 [Monosporascus sp. MC13-8B]|uniref:Enoyl reductase (ER) domain-containing protein n=1 Tax=Monosporascus cannonballus TaxID=155416 RepID=A0ABY0HFF9_9PEZI|nr:hypothetical protein DL762_003299 [Monosporascus cannonballus]RYP00757.1 hypothetical protein DL763_000637 [Monosporascus cannonballus]RYP38496.1 hypothetical protein DL766_000913 [Monosporascus sp. MC13-8B]